MSAEPTWSRKLSSYFTRKFRTPVIVAGTSVTTLEGQHRVRCRTARGHLRAVESLLKRVQPTPLWP